jgi:hypothetical protein
MCNQLSQHDPLRICNICILPETFPGLSFNAEGVCNFCLKSAKNKGAMAAEKEKYRQKFIELLDEFIIRGGPGRSKERSYDILMAYSGGKDSTYAMSLLKLKYGLRVLAVSFDNGFVSETASANIRKVTDNLGIDHIFFKAEWEIMKKIFSAAKERELYSRKSLERASTICTSCIGIVKSVCLKMAIEQDVPMVGFGWSPGQAPIQSSIMKNNPSLIRMAQQAIFDPLKKVIGDAIEVYCLREQHYAQPERFPYNVHPMAWEFYDESMILENIKKFGWVAPEDTDSNSSNCLLNAYANDVHIRKYGFHPYVWEIANMVREGVMTRQEGYEKIYCLQDEDLINRAKGKLGI